MYITQNECYGYSNEDVSVEYRQDFAPPKIFWELNWLSQWDPKLIQFIKENVLIHPPIVKESLTLLNEFNERQPWKHQGTHGEALVVEYIYGLNNSGKTTERRNGKEY